MSVFYRPHEKYLDSGICLSNHWLSVSTIISVVILLGTIFNEMEKRQYVRKDLESVQANSSRRRGYPEQPENYCIAFFNLLFVE